ncbi:hypothetical protein [Nonomuraea sp. NPDC050643]|uniref:hypothetical protein n=1 Tax=Nonomuraea sp. NPDC050643 TaxID=3155660 RepID=UPI0033C34792
MSYGTKFAETEALLAAQMGDKETLRELVEEMLPGERADLHRACGLLADEINRIDGLPPFRA